MFSFFGNMHLYSLRGDIPIACREVFYWLYTYSYLWYTNYRNLRMKTKTKTRTKHTVPEEYPPLHFALQMSLNSWTQFICFSVQIFKEPFPLQAQFSIKDMCSNFLADFVQWCVSCCVVSVSARWMKQSVVTH